MAVVTALDGRGDGTEGAKRTCLVVIDLCTSRRDKAAEAGLGAT